MRSPQFIDRFSIPVNYPSQGGSSHGALIGSVKVLLAFQYVKRGHHNLKLNRRPTHFLIGLLSENSFENLAAG